MILYTYTCSIRLLNVMNQLTEFYPITQIPTPIVRDMFGCSLYPSLGGQPLTFSPSVGDNIQLEEAANPSLSIALPVSLGAASGLSTPPSLAFCAHKTGGFFVRRRSYLAQGSQGALKLSSNVASARLSMGVTVRGLQDPVKMTFSKKEV